MKQASQKLDLTQKLAVLCIFSVFLDKAIRGAGLPFDFYYYYIAFIAFLVSLVYQNRKIFLPPKWFNLGFGAVAIASLFVTIYNGLLGFEYLKQLLGIVFTSLVSYNIFVVFRFDIQRIFEYYLFFAFLVALHAVLDNLLHIAGIHLTPYSVVSPLIIREYGIMGEPFYLAMAITPALAYYTCYFQRTWKQLKFRYLVLLACYLVTYSSTALMGIGLSVFFALYLNNFFNARSNRFVFAPLIIVPIVLLIVNLIDTISLFNKRYYDTTSLFLSKDIDVKEAGKSNSSTFALYSNFIIARDSFLENPLFGSGLGSHPLIYENTFLKYFPPNYLKGYGAQNQQDANSRFLRLLSETGLMGTVLFLLFVIIFFAPKSAIRSAAGKEIAAINYAIFIYILLGLIRNGNYINVGFFFFFFMYYISNRLLVNNPVLHIKQRLSPGLG
ncbi:O-antigen ligase family protein [Flavihumibacter sp. RY-1]|uniref:O-antigen ligase family protein n=1 Tax=Flavihumibacter fluminis TaxID=2909236 RepID=A0ABS9BMW4_9BACT|nr:O-antigen ligase family protein [Flavihumibacter fluminis]MCF1716407.1 O-antigen ligase family protein [Flavihumibacter fluminis]